VKKYIISGFPSLEEMRRDLRDHEFPEYRSANGHIHSPYSFSAFNDLESVFTMAKTENISSLGINDFYVTDGYQAFYDNCIRNKIFPLFNIEFIGLMKKEQANGIRINDPNNPGRIYFCGKGLDYPFHQGWLKKRELDRVKMETQKQLKAMISKLNILIASSNPSLSLSFDEIKAKYARELVRERHIAKAVRYLAMENYSSRDEQLGFIESLYGGKRSKAGLSDPAALENEIRSNLLKAGGAAFVEEDESSFLELKKIIGIITDAGGIPCYPVLLDDPSGRCTEFESDPGKLHSALSKMGVGCIELIPGRNDFSILKDFVEFFDNKGFIILFGTEHNTPEMIPLTVTARGMKPLDNKLKQINWRGVCVIAAHQYLRAQKEQGYIDKDGKPLINFKKEFEATGKLVTEYFLNKAKYETGNF
jgi:hypothetical protein